MRVEGFFLCGRPCLLKLPAVLQMTLLKILSCAEGVHFSSNLDHFARFRCAEIALFKTVLGV